MANTIEKIYCTDGRDNDLAAILATTKNNDPATLIAAMGGGMNNRAILFAEMLLLKSVANLACMLFLNC